MFFSIPVTMAGVLSSSINILFLFIYRYRMFFPITGIVVSVLSSSIIIIFLFIYRYRMFFPITGTVVGLLLGFFALLSLIIVGALVVAAYVDRKDDGKIYKYIHFYI